MNVGKVTASQGTGEGGKQKGGQMTKKTVHFLGYKQEHK